MKSQTEIKPEVDVKFMKIGHSYAVVIPSWFIGQWDLNPTKRYKILVVEELEENVKPPLLLAPVITILPHFDDFIFESVPLD
jgi:hypothetical protein